MRKALISRDGGSVQMPLTLLRSFTPTLREQERLSLFRVNEAAEVVRVAAAWGLVAKDPFCLMSVEEDALKQLGATFEVTKGTTYDELVNGAHLDLVVKNGEDAFKYAQLFYQSGTLHSVEAREWKSLISDDCSHNEEALSPLFEKKNPTALANAADLFNEKWLAVVGKSRAVGEEPKATAQ